MDEAAGRAGATLGTSASEAQRCLLIMYRRVMAFDYDGTIAVVERSPELDACPLIRLIDDVMLTRRTISTNRCCRCGGMMVQTYSDLLSPSARGEEVYCWRCVNCGECVDRQVLLNRIGQGQNSDLVRDCTTSLA